MPFDGAGNFTRDFNFTADKLAGIKIQSVRVDGECDNFSTAFNQVILRSGVAPMTGNLKLGNNSISGISLGAANTPSVTFSGDVTTGLYQPAAGVLGFSIVGVEIARITSTGLQISGIWSGGHGVSFPAAQVPSADPNTLDDYEEGNWVPVLTGDTGATGQTYTVQIGEYIKVGKKVTCWGSLTLSVKGALTGTFAIIAGLPYVPDNTATIAIGGLLVTSGLPNHYSANTYHQFGSNFVYLMLKKTLGVGAPLAVIADVSNGTQIDFTFEYMAGN